MNKLLSVASIYGLEIYDRNYHRKSSGFKYPVSFQKYIVGSLPYDQLVQQYKKYKIGLNVNSVKNSPTMCSRRIYELLASGVMVVSTHSAAVEQMFKNIVQIVPDYKTMKTSLKFTLNHDDWRVKKELEGQRLIFSSHTYAHRLYTIAKSCGIHVKKTYQINVHVISYAQNRKDVKNILTSYKAQDYSHKKLTIFLSKHFSKKEQAALKKIDHVNFIPVNHVKINLANIIRNTDYVSYFNPKHYYGRYFLTDLVWGSIYSGAKIIGKGSYYKYLRDHKLRLINNSDEYTYTSKVLNDGCIVHKSVINSSDIMLCDLMIQNVFLKKVQAQQKFSINAFNFVYHFDASTKNKALIAKVIK
ncbi:glycosyltransferase [Bacillus aquiflavi]|uniref:glycosyltransferase family protein n=1 Tax=Bacillus aquiflavi TaxID=2672567 RepID=UPI001CA8B3E5|nr:glycosyltransferase [Bacillus aquiflavi]UAC49112.1 glycosyltransferase [Bacillus aquiflavi]